MVKLNAPSHAMCVRAHVCMRQRERQTGSRQTDRQRGVHSLFPPASHPWGHKGNTILHLSVTPSNTQDAFYGRNLILVVILMNLLFP